MILLEIKDEIAWITLNRPEVFNSFNREMAFALQDVLDSCHTNEEVRCIVITGSGKAFCAGQDLQEAISMDGPGLEKILEEHFNPIIRIIRSVEKPIIAAVNGVAAGAGANIALCCDIVVASEAASFIQAFSKIGLIPDSGGTFMLPRLMGWNRASAYMMTGEKVMPADALQMGLVYKVFGKDNFIEEVATLAKQIATMPTRGLALTKKALNASFANNLEEQLQVELELQIEAGKTYDYSEGVKAFLEKRNPEFKGK